MLHDNQKSHRNCMGNSHNPWQGDHKKVLCCCSAGLLRSPTTSKLLHNKYGYNTRECGLDPEFALVPCTQALVFWADEIVVQDDFQKMQVQEIIDTVYRDDQPKYHPEIKVLNIEDSFAYMDDELIKLIMENYHVK